jgi:hypothetical protein
VDLEDDDPEIVSKYLSCVYFGAAALRADVEDQEPPRRTYPDELDEDDDLQDAFAWPQKEIEKQAARLDSEDTAYDIACDDQHLFLAKLWLQADKLQDPTTANSVADEIVRFTQAVKCNPSFTTTNHIYESTMHGSPLRKLMRDFSMYCSTAYVALHAFKFHEDVCRDIAVESLRRQGTRPSRCHKPPGFPQILCADSGTYHLLSGVNPRRQNPVPVREGRQQGEGASHPDWRMRMRMMMIGDISIRSNDRNSHTHLCCHSRATHPQSTGIVRYYAEQKKKG